MLHTKIMEQLNETLGKFFKDRSITKDIENNLKELLSAVFTKLDLVTREEFDTQQKVLIATRQKLDEMEQSLKNIMAQ